MKYERLTKRNEYGMAYVQNNDIGDMAILKAFERLAELEDKIENGTLVDFPFIRKFDNYYFMFHFDKYGFITCEKVGETKEEAEAKLKELKDG